MRNWSSSASTRLWCWISSRVVSFWATKPWKSNRLFVECRTRDRSPKHPKASGDYIQLSGILPLSRPQAHLYTFGELVLVAFLNCAVFCLPSSNAVLHIPHRVFRTEQQSISRGQSLDSLAWISNGSSPELHSLKPPTMHHHGRENPWKSLSPKTDSQRTIAGTQKCQWCFHAGSHQNHESLSRPVATRW